MKRSEINALVRSATRCFLSHGWALPPRPIWDVTDFGLGDWRRHGLVLINLAEEPEYCEKLMYAKGGMETPAHTHRRKKEDIICRWGRLELQLWPGLPAETKGQPFTVRVDGRDKKLRGGARLTLEAGSRITLVPGIYHAFQPATRECIIGEVSTANDDTNDNVFERTDIGRFPEVIEDEKPLVRLAGERAKSR